MTPQPSIAAAVRCFADEQRDRIVLHTEEGTRNWGELDGASTRIARALDARGVAEGDLVTIALPNGAAMIECCLAIWKLGATPQPASPKATAEELKRAARLANSPLIISACDDLSELNVPVVSPAALMAACNDIAPLPDRTAPALKAPMSGGSTGSPKLIVAAQPGVVDPLAQMVWRTGADTIAVMPGPLSHNAPFTTAFLTLLGGGTLVLLPRFDAEAVLAAVARHRATWLYLVPTMMHRIMRLPDAARQNYDLSSLKTMWHMAAPCPPWLKQAWIDWIGPDAVWELYAGTEAQAVTIISGREWLDHRGSVGRVVIGAMRILDAGGNEVPPGTTGEIYMKTTTGAASYRYIGAEAERAGEWETLGDIGWFDADGYLYLCDRRADMILVGGSNVYPAEIEQVIDAFPGVVSSAVVGLPDADLGQVPHAIVHSDHPIDEAALRAHVEGLLTSYKRPRNYEFTREDLRDAAGKVRRGALRDARMSTNVTH